MRIRLALALFCGVLCVRAQDLGDISFSTSGGPSAQRQFLKGLLELHNFEYEDAREDFEAARKTEPDFAMAYWGEAMTFNHPLWGEQDAASARAALKTLPAGAKTSQREKLYLAAVEALYGEGSKAARDVAYLDAMRELHKKYPKDVDAACFYALALLGSTEGKRDYAVYMRAAAVLEEVFAGHPRHPGAAHYLIHCYDDPVHAPLGLRAARVYAGIAPAAEHAQHMPSHIFLALGMWDREVSSNETSWAVSEARVVRKKLGVDELGFHALYWLEYGYLQQGRYREARKTLGLMEDSAQHSKSPRVRSSLIMMRAAYLAETGRWTAAVALANVDDLHAGMKATDLFVNAMAKVETGFAQGAEANVAELRKMASGSEENDSLAVGILAGELESAAQMKREKIEPALEAAAASARLEDKLNFEFGPPFPVIPAHEFYGEMLLRAGRTKEAAKEFRIALDRAPGRAHSLLGLARAGQGSIEGRQALAELERNWSRADSDVKGPALAALLR